MSTQELLARAGRWLIESGIHEPNGGVARYYLADLEKNRPVSTEITGYAISTYVYLHSLTADESYLDGATAAANFLVRSAWDPRLLAMPFEPDQRLTYFFDCGIVVRGLLAIWRETGHQPYRDVALAVGRAMARDFANGDGRYHPILQLPEKKASAWGQSWSRSPGCYQLKAALAWHDLFEATGIPLFESLYQEALETAVCAQAEFLPARAGTPEERMAVMDRLHAYCYFLEGLLPEAKRENCARALCHGIAVVSRRLREIAPLFARSDVYAQLLRIRLLAHGEGIVAIDLSAAREEAEALAAFQAEASDPRIDGGFYFGRRGDALALQVNPVSTAFALQALTLWASFSSGRFEPCCRALI